MDQVSFRDLKLIEPIERSLKKENYSTPTPIQAQAIPFLLEGRDLLGCAQTGTGKTAAFALPLLQRLHLAEKKKETKRRTRSLILTPTRELAMQISESFQKYGRHLNLSYATVYGGVSHIPQIRKLSQGVDILIATPGRLIDLLNEKHLRLDAVETLVLDEADRMLDMGFIHDVQKIIKQIPEKRQTLLFSATMPKEVAHLAEKILTNPKKIKVNTVSSTADLIDDQVLFVESKNKQLLLLEILSNKDAKRALVFTRTKHRANRLSEQLKKKGIKSEVIHSNKTQGARQRALKAFSAGKIKVMVATDIISRGIDVTGISHVINYELPNESESYVHRVGRTARAGTTGIALSFCCQEETNYLANIEKMLKRNLVICEDHSYHSESTAQTHAKKLNNKNSRKNSKRRSSKPHSKRRSKRPPRRNSN